MTKNAVLVTSVFIITLLCLTSCKSGTHQTHFVTNATLSTAAKTINNSIYNIGGTYDTSSGMPTILNSCLVNGDNLDNITIISPSTKLDFTQAVDYRTIKNAMGFDFEAKLDLGITKVKTEQHYANTARDDSLHMNINYIYKYSGKALFNNTIDIQGEKSLTQPALTALHTTPTEFRTLCGDRVVTELDAGVNVFIRLTLNFASHSEKNTFDSTIADLGGLQGVLTKLKNRETGTQFTITASGLQLGGNPHFLNQLFLTHGGRINADGYPEVNCSARDSDSNNCAALMDSVIDYATTVSEQIKTKSDFSYSNPVLSNWKSLGIKVDMPYIAPDISRAINELNTLIIDDLHKQRVISDYQTIYQRLNELSPEFNAQISRINTLYTQFINSYSDSRFNLGATCATGYITNTCIDSVNTFKDYRNNIFVDNAELIADTNYLISNVYTSKLITAYPIKHYTVCDLIPISFATTHQYIIDCDGQITFNNNPAKSLTIYRDNKDLFVNNLSYTIAQNFVPNTFSYNMNNINYHLKPDKNLDFIYTNKTDIMANESVLPLELLSIMNSPW